MPADLSYRLVFPEDRTSFIYGRPGDPIRTPFRTGLQIYGDPQGDELADILGLDGSVIEHSTVYTGEDSLLPQFYGPPGNAAIVWARVVGGTDELYPLAAEYSGQISILPTLIPGHGPPSVNTGVPGSSYLDVDTQTIYSPKTSTWPPGVSLRGPQGFAGGAFTHQQNQPDKIWVIDHILTFRPSVTTLDSSGSEMWGDVSYPSMSRIVVEFGAQFGGIALLS